MTAEPTNHCPYSFPHEAFAQPVSASVKCRPPSNAPCQYFAVIICERAYVWSWITPFGRPVVPDVKYMSMASSALVSILSIMGVCISASAGRLSKPSTPSAIVHSDNSRSVIAFAFLMFSGTLSKGVMMTAFASEAEIRYAKSSAVSIDVTGIITAPIRSRATAVIQYS